MSIQSTVSLTRKDAVAIYMQQRVDENVRIYREQITEMIAREVKYLSNEALENALEEKFFNYQIID